MANEQPINQSTAFDLLGEVKKMALGINDRTDENDLAGFYISFLPTGIAINKNDYENPYALGGNNDNNPSAKKNLANVCNIVDKRLQFKGDHQCITHESKFSNIYKLILDSAQPVVSHLNLSPEEKIEIDNANNLLKKPSPIDPEIFIDSAAKKQYNYYFEQFSAKNNEYTAKYISSQKDPESIAAWNLSSQIEYRRVQLAHTDWEILGRKEEIDNASNIISSQSSDAAVNFIANAKKIAKAELNKPFSVEISPGNNILYSTISPSNWCDPEASGWNSYHFNSKNVNSEHNVKNISYGGSAGYNSLFWSVDADAAHNETIDKFNSELSGLEIRFEYTIAEINRPWMDTILFRLPNWYLRNNKANTISDNSENQLSKFINNNNELWLPTVTTKLVLIRNLFISNEYFKSMDEQTQENTKIGGGVQILGFNLSADYSEDSMKAKIAKTEYGTGISCKGVQLIGYVSEIIPSSPKMDSPTVQPE